jgi:hypothetical protein
MTPGENLAIRQLADRLAEVSREVTTLGKNQAAVLEHKQATDERLDGLHATLVENRDSLGHALRVQGIQNTKLDYLAEVVERSRPLLSRTGWRIGTIIAIGGVLIGGAEFWKNVNRDQDSQTRRIGALSQWATAVELDRSSTLPLVANLCRWTERMALQAHVQDGQPETCDSLAALGARAHDRAKAQNP